MQERRRHVEANEAGGAGDENGHEIQSRMMVSCAYSSGRRLCQPRLIDRWLEGDPAGNRRRDEKQSSGSSTHRALLDD
jgi:hypothetical protein